MTYYMTYYTSRVVGAVPEFRTIGGTMSMSNSMFIHVCMFMYIYSFHFILYILMGVGGKSETGEDFVSYVKHLYKVFY